MARINQEASRMEMSLFPTDIIPSRSMDGNER